jgi:transcriptional regulator with XRE-family HTH domain
MVVNECKDHDDHKIGNARYFLAKNLKELRATKGFSQEDLALEAGLHRTFVSHLERGARNASIDNIEKLAIALGVSTYRLLVDPDVLRHSQN